MASSDGDIVSQLQKHTECPICLTTFNDPRVLPCLHTFCMKCLESTASSTNKTASDEMPCPTCRTGFTVPLNGFAGLMINFNMNSLIAMANHANSTSSVKNTNCDRHKTNPLGAFCLKCEQPVCITCLTDNHQGHKAVDAAEVTKIFAKEIAPHVEKISGYKKLSSDLIKQLDEKKEAYMKKLVENESEILKRSKELIDQIEKNTKSLLEDLSSLKAQHLAEMEKEREELLKQCAIIESYQSYCETTVTNASLVDICCVKKELPIAVNKLDEWYKTRKISSFEVLLQPQNEVIVDLLSESSNIVGTIKGTIKDSLMKFMDRPQRIKSIDTTNSVWGIALLNKKVYVSSIESKEISVYESVTLAPLKNIKCPAEPRDIAGYQFKNCLFAVCTDSLFKNTHGTIFCLGPDGKVIAKWGLPCEPHNLSITSTGTVLVMCAGLNPKILEYSSNGILLKNLDMNGTNLHMSWQAISLPSDNYLVCQGWWSELHRVVVLDKSGHLIHSFGNEAGSSADSLNNPVYMALDKDGCIFVADSDNNRVVLLSKELVFLKHLLTEADDIVEPYRVLLDETAGQLYVGTNKCRLCVYRISK